MRHRGWSCRACRWRRRPRRLMRWSRFVTRRDDLDSAGQAVAAARADRLAWISYPKGGQLGTDLNRDRLAAALAGRGVQPVRQVSVDDTWPALRFRPASR